MFEIKQAMVTSTNWLCIKDASGKWQPALKLTQLQVRDYNMTLAEIKRAPIMVSTLPPNCS